MPTLGSQGDVQQAKHGVHGDYLGLVFHPNSVAECYQYAGAALNAAEEALAPVILLVDGVTAHLTETADLKKIPRKLLVKRRLVPLGEKRRHFTGLTSVDNRPETSDAAVYRKWYRERKQAIIKVAEKYAFYDYYPRKKSELLVIAYGITSRVVMALRDKYPVFRPGRLFPIIPQLKKIASRYPKIAVVEMNDGQYRSELAGFLKREVVLVSQLGGQVSLKEIENELEKISQKS